MRKTISTFLALVLVSFMTVSDISAQSRIAFRRGSSSATVSGTIGVNRGVGGGNYRSYVLRARRDQTITATVSSRNGRVAFADNDSTSLTIYTDSNGDYIIRIYNGGASSSTYKLTVSIN